MSIRTFTIGLFLSCLPVTALAAGNTVFDLYFDSIGKVLPSSQSEVKIRKFAMEEMRGWSAVSGVVDLTIEDIAAAEKNDLGLLCRKRDAVILTREECLQLQRDIMAIIEGEREAQSLGDDLVSLAASAELSTMDEPHHSMHLGRQTLLLQRLLSGTGTHMFSWPTNTPAAATLLQKIDAELANPEARDALVYQFHYGYFKSLSDADPRFQQTGSGMRIALRDLAALLGITGNPQRKGEYVTPKLATKNIALWARGDDLGLLWIYPTKHLRFTLERGGKYPILHRAGSGTLSYPFEYKGTKTQWPTSSKTPLCSRSAGALGYLCRMMNGVKTLCERPVGTDGSVVLTECDLVQEERKAPDICAGLPLLFKNDGTPFQDPKDPSRMNPGLVPAGAICQPDAKILYKDELLGHACYISSCIAESLNGHTLIPGRNPSILGEMTTPFEACARPDPQLGIFAELASPTPYALPQYVGHELQRDFEAAYCAKSGLAPESLPGLCAYGTSRRTNSPLQTFGQTFMSTAEELRSLHEDQTHLLWQAAAIGERRAIDQALPIYQKIISSFAQNVKEIANLFLELTQAPITKTSCPSTGPFRVSYPQPQ